MAKRKSSLPLSIPRRTSFSSFNVGQGMNSFDSSPPIMGASSSAMNISYSPYYANSPSTFMTGPSREIGTQTPTEKLTFDFPDSRRGSRDSNSTDDETGDVGRSLRMIGDELDRRGSSRRNSLILFLRKSL